MYENDIYSNQENSGYTSYQTSYSTGTGYGTNGTENGKAEKKKKGTFRKFMVSMGLGVTFGVFAGAGFYAVHWGTNQYLPAQVQETVSPESLPEEKTSGSNKPVVNQVTYVSDDVSGVVEEVMPAMVSIVNTATRTSSFWGYTYEQSVPSAGSGIIVEERDGELLIISNNHVVADADSLEVTFIDGTTAAANIKGQDSEMDLAVISVPTESLSEETRNAIAFATLGNSDDLKLGEPVIAIGNALGNGQSVTNGIISALNREVTNEDGTTGTYIQTNAAINGGNSGGALLTITGEVIGINSGKIKATGVEGMGYAIPISSASPIIADLMNRETRTEVASEEERGYLGIYFENVSSQMAQMYGMPQGVFVKEVTEGSAAEKAGMQKRDILVKFDGQKIGSYEDLQGVLQYYKAGETVTVTVKRLENGEYESYDLELTLGTRPQEER